MSGVPQGWVIAPLNELFEFRYGKGLPKETRTHGHFNVYGSNGIVGQHDASVTQGPTIVVGRKGSVGEVHLSLQPCWPIDTTYFVDHFPGRLPPRYWALFLKSLRLGQQEKSSAIPGISRDDIYKLEIPLPPLNEQRRIVAKLEELLARVDASKKRLEKIPVILKRFRQAVLAAACSGRLTADWREENPGCVGAPLAGAQRGRAQDPPLQDRGEGEELPEGWKWVSLADVCSAIVDCPHSTPKWAPSGKLCVRTTNFKPGFLDLAEVRYVSAETFTERIQRLRPVPGDILYSREGGILGIACIIPEGTELCLGQRMMLFRTKKTYAAQLLMHWLNSPPVLTRVQDLTGGSASPHLNVRDIKAFPTPLPPLPEQHEIVRRVEALFTLADQLEDRYRKAKAHVDKLTQSILAKAFRGELVPQDPNDEPASVLLERIRAEKAPSPLPLSRKERGSKANPCPQGEGGAKRRVREVLLAAEPAVAYGATVPQRLLAAMKPNRDYSRAELTAASGIIDAEWTWAIRQLKEEGKVRQSGERRGARYRRR